MQNDSDRKICIEAFDNFNKVVRKSNENEGFNNIGPCVVLVGEKKAMPIPHEVITEDDLVSLTMNMPMLNEELGNIVGLCAGLHVMYSVPTMYQIADSMIYETEDFYAVMNVILDRNGGSPKERTLIMDDKGHFHHIDKMAFQEPFQEPLRRMKSIASCITSFNFGYLKGRQQNA